MAALAQTNLENATCQVVAIVSTIITSLADAMPYKTKTLPSEEKVFQMIALVGKK